MAWNLETFNKVALPLVAADLTIAKTIALNVTADPNTLGGTVDFTSPYVTGDARVHTEADRRSRTHFTFDDLVDTKTPITLTDYIYKGTHLPYDFETFSMTSTGLKDIVNQSASIVARRLNRIASGVLQGVIDGEGTRTVALVADRDENVEIVLDAILDLKMELDENGVDAGERTLAVSNRVARILLTSKQFRSADVSGDTNALRLATIGLVAGFTVIQDSNLEGVSMVAYEKYGFGLVMRPKAKSIVAGVDSEVTLAEDSSVVLNTTVGQDINENADKIIVGTFVGAKQLDPARSAAVTFTPVA